MDNPDEIQSQPVGRRSSEVQSTQPLIAPEDAGDERSTFVKSGIDDTSRHAKSFSKRPPKAAHTGDQAAAPLQRSSYIVFLVLAYATLAVFAWTVLCILTYRPINARSYGVWSNDVRDSYDDLNAQERKAQFAASERYFEAARVIQSVVAVLTIPLTSAVCAKAAVVYTQRRMAGLTLRQMMVLADSGWSDFVTLGELIVRRDWKRMGTTFLFIAIALNILGGVISPVQQLFLSYRTIKTPTYPQNLLPQTDIYDLTEHDPYNTDSNLVTVLTRNALAATSNVEPQSRLWQGNAPNCTYNTNYSLPVPAFCQAGGATLGDVGTLNIPGMGTNEPYSPLGEPFLAQLPSGYNTGLLSQYLLRVNSTASVEAVPIAQFPQDCDKLPGAFYASYTNYNASTEHSWNMTACMPTNQTKSPWKGTRKRQDFSETLFLNISVFSWEASVNVEPNSALMKVTVNTTAGYFELPNYMNGNVPGALVQGDPNDNCSISSWPQGYEGGSICATPTNSTAKPSSSTKRRPRRDVLNGTQNGGPLEQVISKGPLLTIALALFGEGSFIAERVANPWTFYTNLPYDANYGDSCIDVAPMQRLLRYSDDLQANFGGSLDPCVTNDGMLPEDQVAMYLYSLAGDRAVVAKAFTASAFLANEALITNPGVGGQANLLVSYDLGLDTQVPVIPLAGIILISVLLALDLGCLLAMAVYSSRIPSWTSQLDSFAMLRIGSSIGERLPFLYATSKAKIEVLDELPGWIGDQAVEDRAVGELGLGAATMLRARRKYRCFDDGGMKHEKGRD